MAGVLAAALLVGAGGGGRVYPSAEQVEPLEPGSRVPSVQVTSVSGKPVDLSELLRDRGATLVFYRGGW